MIDEFMKAGKVPGLFVAVVKNDSVLFQYSVGKADDRSGVPVSENTCFELGSVIKAFTAEIILQLKYEHKLNLDDAITKYFPDAPATWSSVTIRHLLDHTSGIRNYLLDPRFNNPFSPVSIDSMIHLFYTLPLEFKPGTTWSYSNTGYYLLGKISEIVSGKSYFDLLTETILLPLQMKQTQQNERASANGCLAKGYTQIDNGVKSTGVLMSSFAFSAGGIATSGADMVQYLKAINRKSLPSDIANDDWRHYTASYDLPFDYHEGRFYSIFHGKHIISHNGGTPGFSSSWFYVLEDTISIIVLINRSDYAPIDNLAWDILSQYDHDLIYPNKKLNSPNEKSLPLLPMRVLNAIKTNKLIPGGLTPPLKILLESENGRNMWKWIFEKGFPASIECVDEETINKSKILRFRVNNSAQPQQRLTVLFNEKNELAQMSWW